MSESLDYGIIGNCRSAALVSSKGSLDWLCLPDFDSSSVFAKILDTNKGGEFSILIDESFSVTQKYLDRTNILITTFRHNEDSFEVIDFMPRYKTEENLCYNASEVYRYIRHLSGKPKVRFRYKPALNYAITPTFTEVNSNYIKSKNKKGTYESVYLYSDFDFNDILQEKEIEISCHHFFLVTYNQKLIKMDINRVYLEYQRTKVYWMNWVNRSTHYPMYNKELIRSALTLKMLTYDKTGAVLAAVTTSLPETIGNTRNWDYRFCWIRDSSMIIEALLNLNHQHTAGRFLQFLMSVIPEKDEKLQIMYGIRGEKKLTEEYLDHLSGYKNSKPVRIGNSAYMQKQNDIYGILMDVILKSFLSFPNTLDTSEELWTITRSIIRTVENNWNKPDRGIWELRSEHRHFVFSKVLSWVAIDRAIKIAEILNMHSFIPEWEKLANKIRLDVYEKGWNSSIEAFTQSYGSPYLDAANLLMEKYGFINADDPRYVKTVIKTKEKLSRNGLMYRYLNNDDFGVPESAFTICTFWMIDALYKIGEKEQAVIMFENLLTCSNHLGLFSEDIDFEHKTLLGNFPQGYSHLALIQTAILLNNLETPNNQFKFIKP